MKNSHNPKKAVHKIIVIVVGLLLVFSIVPRAKTVWELSRQREALKQQKAELMHINKQIAKKCREASSPEVIEQIAREQLGMVKKGEKSVIQVIPAGQKTE